MMYITILLFIDFKKAYADDILGTNTNTNTQKKNTHTDDLVAASKEIRLEVNADKTSTWSWFEIRMQDED